MSLTAIVTGAIAVDKATGGHVSGAIKTGVSKIGSTVKGLFVKEDKPEELTERQKWFNQYRGYSKLEFLKKMRGQTPISRDTWWRWDKVAKENISPKELTYWDYKETGKQQRNRIDKTILLVKGKTISQVQALTKGKKAADDPVVTTKRSLFFLLLIPVAIFILLKFKK